MFLQGYEIVEKLQGEMVVSHRVIAEHTEVDEKALRNIINRFYDDFAYFGANVQSHFKNATVNQAVRFKNATVTNSVGAVNKQKTYYLNEQQATLLMTYLRNSEVVRGFKMALVEEFFTMREQIHNALKYTHDGKETKRVLGAYKSHTKQAYKRLRDANDGIERYWIPSVKLLEEQRSDLYWEKERYKRELAELKEKTKRFKY